MSESNRDHVKLICHISELLGLFPGLPDLEEFLQRIVEMVSAHMGADVCSIYIYYQDKRELVLKATKGLNPEFIGKVKMGLAEGLTGQALREERPVLECNASRNPNFRYFPGLGEERYESFLAVPILRGMTKIGVMAVQNTSEHFFGEEEVKALRAITAQLANTIETAKLFLSIEEKHTLFEEKTPGEGLSFVKGTGASPGIAYGEIVLVGDETDLRRYCRSDGPLYTLEDFNRALEKTALQLEKLQRRLEERACADVGMIFTAQRLMVKDKGFVRAITEQIKRGAPPPRAVVNTVEEYVKRFEAIPNAYLREKSHDILDVGREVLENLVSKDRGSPGCGDRVVLARQLLPSDIIKLSLERATGVILLSGGALSHLSILSRSLELPLVVADCPKLSALPPDTRVLLDGERGNIYINPSREIRETFNERERTTRAARGQKDTVSPRTYTRDGERVILQANINLLADLKNACDFKAEGVGLYRSEFPFIIRNEFPSEEEQYLIYKKLAEDMPGRELTFRTLDIGGDKVLSYFDEHADEKNPFLGMRSIRFSLRHREIFSQQLRAILRAGDKANTRIMFPMISSLEEFLQARETLLSCVKGLREEGVELKDPPRVGLMLELPAVLDIMEDLAPEADFFCIGTNDFIQYTLAVDRTNEKVADLFLPHHPAVLRGLKRMADTAVKYGKDICICGDMAQDKRFTEFLLGIGLRKLSLSPVFLPGIQEIIQKTSLARARKTAALLLSQKRLEDIKRLLEAGRKRC